MIPPLSQQTSLLTYPATRQEPISHFQLIRLCHIRVVGWVERCGANNIARTVGFRFRHIDTLIWLTSETQQNQTPGFLVRLNPTYGEGNLTKSS